MNTRTPGMPLEKICPDVEPIEGEPGRYYVRSRSEPHKVYLVDIQENGFIGKCNCPLFEFRLQRDIDRGISPNWNQACYHVKRAERYFLEMMKRALWAERNTFSKPNEGLKKIGEAAVLPPGVPGQRPASPALVYQLKGPDWIP